MRRLTITILGLAIALSGAAQSDYVDDWNPDADGDGNVGVTDLLALLSVFSENDVDGDGIWDSVDDCIGVYDACGVCNGTGEDADEDGLCDDVDDCVGAYDECGVCNGPGPNIPVIDEILYETDSVFIEVLGEWYVFEYATDTIFSFACPDACSDVSAVNFDGYTYDLVAIGDQCWFAENLRTEYYANGDAIPANLTDSEWSSTTSGAVSVFGEDAGCVDYSPDGDACDPSWSLNEYGRLYNWYAVDDERGLCPTGWHVPTDGEWMTLEMELGMSESDANSATWRGTDQGTQMKTTYGWYSGGNGTNSSGFSGLPGGWRYEGGSFFDAGGSGYWWSSSPSGSFAWGRDLNHSSPEVYRYVDWLRDGFSVRCLKDAE
ncbi:fibrobacter succinogenes major paralogous domain-containing protein [Flavobacteriales bacterium]|nr:fibrobacter succinogenes major paralogous domain-containing protein [Flavobacteriales bacterium]MDA9019298.1 fibrobacter succinogenes major paralogous domain-containing protein [Flavobacteriales bacterium]